jgi:hypothetical protein
MDPFISSFENDQRLIGESLNYEGQKKVATEYLPLKPAKTTRQKFTEDNLTSLALREELERTRSRPTGYCNSSRVDFMTDGPTGQPEPKKTKSGSISSMIDALTQDNSWFTILLFIIIILIIVSYNNRIDHLSSIIRELMTQQMLLLKSN